MKMFCTFCLLASLAFIVQIIACCLALLLVHFLNIYATVIDLTETRTLETSVKNNMFLMNTVHLILHVLEPRSQAAQASNLFS